MALGAPKLDLLSHALSGDETDYVQASLEKIRYPGNANPECVVGSQNEFNASLFQMPFPATLSANNNLNGNGSMSMFRNGKGHLRMVLRWCLKLPIAISLFSFFFIVCCQLTTAKHSH